MQSKIILGVIAFCCAVSASAKTIYLKPHEYRMRASTPIAIKIKGENYLAFKSIFVSNNHYCFHEGKNNYCVNIDRLADYANE